MAAPPYVELRCRSAFSFLDGASLPEDLVAAAGEQGHAALALADRDGLPGAPRFFGAARKSGGPRPIVGAELTLAAEPPGVSAGRAGASTPPLGGSGTAPPPLLLLVEDRRGYQNLCRLITAMKEGRPKGQGAATHTMLREHAGGLVALGGAAPRVDLPVLLDIYGRSSVYLEVQRHLDRAEAQRVRAAEAQAAALGAGLVASNDVRYARPAGKALQDVLTCARLRTSIDTAGRRLLGNAERHLKAPADMAMLFRDRPAALAATRVVAERCAFTLADLGYQFPSYPVPRGETEQSFLEKMTWQGAAGRYRPLGARARAQLARELAIIGKLELGGYFLVVWDLVCFARERGILAQGRGSAANSAVCYALGITAVDPVGMDLLFERFLSEERVRTAQSAADRLPDIDIDLPSGDPREQVIQHVYQKYGARGAAMTANVITYRPRMAVRDAGRALGFGEELLGRVSRHLPHHVEPHAGDGGERLDTDVARGGAGDAPLLAYLADAGLDPGDARTRLLARVATDLQNLPRHLGQHSGGMVIAAGRLDQVVPLEPASMPGRVIVQWDKDDCADLGIVKVDLLGLGMLAVLSDAQELVRAHEGVELDYAHLPPDDPTTYRMLRAADTVGVFQVESRAQMATLPRMKPERFYDLVVEVAIIRPGPIVGKMVNPYLERRNRREPVTFPHPSLEPILARTLGVPLFQEQLIRMAMVAAGFSGGQADELRRAMGFKRSAERMNHIERDLRAGMAARGITGAAQDEIVAGIKSFALYGFPESHAASFALIAYASAFLKAHHHTAFTCALYNNWPMGFYHPATLVTDARRHGVRTLPVDVTLSGWRCGIEGRGSIRLGLKYARGLGEDTAGRIVAGRPYASIADLHARAAVGERDMTTLAEIGALGALGGTRREALWQVQTLGRSGPLFDGTSVSDNDDDAEPALPPMTADERAAADFRGTGLTTGAHPVSFLRPALRARGVLSAAELARARHGQRVATGGVVIVRQRPGTAKGLLFVTLEDETGFANAVVMPDVLARWRRMLLGQNALVIHGVVQSRDGVVTLKADRFEPLPGAGAAAAISHDFR